MAEWTGRKHAISCSSGTAALHLAIGASGYHFAVIPVLTYVATANAAEYCNQQIIFHDVDPASWCLPAKINVNTDYQVLTLGVDLYDSLFIGSSDYPFAVDASESHITCGDALFSTFSFYGNKLITTGEGGIVLTDDDDLAQQIKLYRGQGATIPGDYNHSVIGYNYRMTDLQAAVGLAQLERIDEFIVYRRMIIDRYRENLRDDKRFTLQGGQRANGWMFALLLPGHVERVVVQERMREANIETRPFFRPIPSLSPYFESDWQEKYPVATDLYRRGICLPTHVNLTIDDVDYICETLQEVVRNG
jgi:perosamine synthetase